MILISTSLILTSCGVLAQSSDRATKLPVPPCPDQKVSVTWYGPQQVFFTDGTSRSIHVLDSDDKRILDEWIRAWIHCSLKREQVINVLNGD